MIKHYVKVALRLIKRSFLFSSINMLGFGIWHGSGVPHLSLGSGRIDL